ncbi:MAG TPA: hypothetical protein PLD88_13430 [Candidatus Berkiella sp.]|nr:hypothetical protein [Candidatus Berkiella sp.]
MFSNKRDKQLEKLITRLSFQKDQVKPSVESTDIEMLSEKLSKVAIELKKAKNKILWL